uniref:Homeodomain-like protein n=1 Tax=Tanacetum cinerariifolium TaxID=118510 RepID=A0A6L2JKD9_TANCI|nr:homeodomain-like protein [Tanacetum cinerariifolium]
MFDEWMERFRENAYKNLKRRDSVIKSLEENVSRLAKAVRIHSNLNRDKTSDLKSSTIISPFFVNSNLPHDKNSTRQELLKKIGTRGGLPLEAPAKELGTFAERVKRHIKEEQENGERLLQSLEKEPVNTPLVNTIRQTSDYTKCLQELVSGKIKIEEASMEDPCLLLLSLGLTFLEGKYLGSQEGKKIEEPEGLEEFLKNDGINGDLGDFLEEYDVLPKIDWDTLEGIPDSDDEIRIGLEDLGEGDEIFWDTQDLVIVPEIIPPLRPYFLRVRNRIHHQNPYHLYIAYKIGFVNFNPYIDLISPINVTSRAYYNKVISHELAYVGNNFVRMAKNLHVFVRCHTFWIDFIVLEDISEFVEKGSTEVLFGKPFKD